MIRNEHFPWLNDKNDAKTHEIFFIKAQDPHVEGTILFIHGFSSSYFLHDVFVKNNIFKHFNYLSINVSDHTFSQEVDKNLKEFDLLNYVEEIKKVLLEKQIYNIYVIAHSMGAAIALFLENQMPERFKCFIFVDPINPSIYWSRIGLKYLLFTLWNKPKNIRKLEIEKEYIDDQVIEQYLEYEIERFLKNKKRFILIGSKLINPTLMQKINKLYHKINLPTMIVMGSKDKVIPYNETKRYIEKLKNRKIKFLTIDGAGHVPFIENFKKYNQIVWWFINSVKEHNFK